MGGGHCTYEDRAKNLVMGANEGVVRAGAIVPFECEGHTHTIYVVVIVLPRGFVVE